MEKTPHRPAPKEAVDFGLIDTIIDKRLNKKQDSEENKI